MPYNENVLYAPSATYKDGVYYLYYCQPDREFAEGVATSASPTGPFTGGVPIDVHGHNQIDPGVFVDNNHCNPRNWNNHGSIAVFKGQWYVFYHRSTHGCNKMRKACVEPVTILPDGSIPEVEMTSQGAGPPIKAATQIEAEWACILNGNLRIEQFEPHNEKLTQIYSGDKAAWKYIDFGNGADSLVIRLKAGSKGGRMVVSIDKPWHTRLAVIEIEPEENGGWQTRTFPVQSAAGVHALWLHFYGEDGEMVEVDWFRFN